MEGQSKAAVLLRGLVFLAWLASALVSSLWLLFGFGVFFLGPLFTIQLVMPLVSAVAWVVCYRLRVKSPWIDMVVGAAPITQIAYFSGFLFLRS